MDEGIDKRFQMVGTMDMGKEKYRHPIQFDIGGQAASYDPDGGPYITGTGAEYQQFTVVPIPIIVAVGATELLDRISKGSGLSIIDPVARMIADVKKAGAHPQRAFPGILTSSYWALSTPPTPAETPCLWPTSRSATACSTSTICTWRPTHRAITT